MLGFTLAEVLITLVIIGVIAAITVPTLINKTNNQEYVSKLKKAYSTLAQVTNLIIAEEGTPKASVDGWAKDRETIFNLYKKHLINAKECSVGQDCWNSGIIKNLNGNNYASYDSATYPKLVLADGTLLHFWDVSEDCSLWSRENVCFLLDVDVNGVRKPNTFGKDNFEFFVTTKGLYPRGCDGEQKCTENGSGHSCACRVLREGAINY